MAPPVSITAPTLAAAGDSFAVRVSDPARPTAEGWVPTINLVNPGGRITLTGVAEGDVYLIAAAAAVTVNWAPGLYRMSVSLSKGADRYTIHAQDFTLTPDPATATPYDARSHARRTLDALEAWIESKNMSVASYRIGERQMQYIPIDELLKLRSVYRAEVRREEMSAAGHSFTKLQVRI